MCKNTILIVDDDKVLLKTISKMLKSDKHIILTAPNGKKGLSKLRANKVDLIISDQSMPEMNGLEFLRRVKELNPEIPRIMLTAYDDIEVALEAINEVGIYNFILKPCNKIDLDLIVKRAIEYRILTRERDLLLEIVSDLDPEIREQIKEKFIHHFHKGNPLVGPEYH